MRRHYLDNIRWITVILVVIYHVIYMYNGVQPYGVAGPFKEVQYQDTLLYLLYPWFMVLLFAVSGVSSRLYLENHTHKEFIKTRTRKLLVPSTLGLFVFGWIQGYYNMAIGGAFDTLPDTLPGVVKYLIMAVSGIGVFWYIQLLWIFSLVLVLIRLLEKDRLYALGKKAGIVFLVLFSILVYLSAQVLNTPVITVYRFGIYGLGFLTGYFVLSHEAVTERLSKYWLILSVAALVLGITYTILYFGENYAVEPYINNPLACAFCWITVLAIFAVGKRWLDVRTDFTAFMSRKAWGIYVFHYLPISVFAHYQRLYFKQMPAPVCYILAAFAAFAVAFILYETISRIPVIRWFVLGIRKEKNVQR